MIEVTRKKSVMITVAAALTLAVPFIGGWEGKRNDPYKDIAGVWTVCYGETRVAMKTYSDKECLNMLNEGVTGFAQPVIDMTPTLIERPYALAAATSLAYNIGLSNYKNSTVRKRFLKEDIKGGCEAFMMWTKAKVNGKLQSVKGLVNRRTEERLLCLKEPS